METLTVILNPCCALNASRYYPVTTAFGGLFMKRICWFFVFCILALSNLVFASDYNQHLKKFGVSLTKSDEVQIATAEDFARDHGLQLLVCVQGSIGMGAGADIGRCVAPSGVYSIGGGTLAALGMSAKLVLMGYHGVNQDDLTDDYFGAGAGGSWIWGGGLDFVERGRPDMPKRPNGKLLLISGEIGFNARLGIRAFKLKKLND